MSAAMRLGSKFPCELPLVVRIREITERCECLTFAVCEGLGLLPPLSHKTNFSRINRYQLPMESLRVPIEKRVQIIECI